MEELPKINFTEAFDFAVNEEIGLDVSGFSVHEGIYKDDTVEIPRTELKNVADSLINVPLMKDHILSVDNIVGTLTDTEVCMDGGVAAVRYKGSVTDDEKLQGKITKGLVKNVSIGFRLTPICSKCGQDFRECEHWFGKDCHIIAKDIVCHEQSFVPIGADRDSTVEPGRNFEDEFISQFSYKLEKLSDKLGDKKNTFKDTPNGENMEEKAKLEAKIELLEGQLESKDSEIEALKAQHEGEVEALQTEKVGVETELRLAKNEIEEKNVALEAFESDENERQALAHRVKCETVAKEEMEKGILTEEEFEDRVEEFVAMSEPALEAVISVLSKYEKARTQKIGDFHGEQGSPISNKEGEGKDSKKEFSLREISMGFLNYGKE